VNTNKSNIAPSSSKDKNLLVTGKNAHNTSESGGAIVRPSPFIQKEIKKILKYDEGSSNTTNNTTKEAPSLGSHDKEMNMKFRNNNSTANGKDVLLNQVEEHKGINNRAGTANLTGKGKRKRKPFKAVKIFFTRTRLSKKKKTTYHGPNITNVEKSFNHSEINPELNNSTRKKEDFLQFDGKNKNASRFDYSNPGSPPSSSTTSTVSDLTTTKNENNKQILGIKVKKAYFIFGCWMEAYVIG
jgi:hypothetical protein